MHWRRLVRSFWVSPREHPDFAWAWVTRFLVNLGNWIALNYLYYFLTDGLGFSDDDATAKLGVARADLRRVHGRDHRRRRSLERPHRSAQGLRHLVRRAHRGQLARARHLAGLAGALLAAVILGAGFGVYQAVDFALITQVLPAPVGRAKDLGVINIASALPQVLAPAIAGLILVAVRALGGSRRHPGRVVVARLRRGLRRRLRRSASSARSS